MDNITLKKTGVYPRPGQKRKPESERFLIKRVLNHTATLLNK